METKFKSIDIDGFRLLYKVTYYTNECGYAYKITTSFFQETKFVPVWTFLKWKSKDLEEIPGEILFTIPINIRDERYSKEEIKNKISEGLKIYLRRLEIKEDNII